MHRYPTPLSQLILLLKKLPSVGSKTAERFAFELLRWPEEELRRLATVLADLQRNIATCSHCYCFLKEKECLFCHNPTRNEKTLCVVSSPKDVYAIEETAAFRGHYFVIQGLLSPISGNHPHRLRLEQLLQQVQSKCISEVILALDATLEGDATAFYLKKQLSSLGVSVSRLAFGLPLGSALDFVDEGTLTKALLGRLPLA